MRLSTLTLVALATLLACASHDEGASSSSSSPVVGGYFDDGAGPTVAVFRCDGACVFTPYLNAIEICSGTLIAPNLVLTARHCVAPTIDVDQGVQCSKSTFGAVYPADELIITPASHTHTATEWIIAREIDVPGATGDLDCGNDVAVLHLRQPYVGSAPTAPRLTTPPVKGEVYSAVGYGDDLDGGLGYRHRRDGLKIQCVGSACTGLGTDLTPLITDAELLGQTGLCGGDSGGPALDANGLVIGVTSRAGAGCTLPIYSRVDSHAAWLQAQAIKAASAGNYPLPAWAYVPLPSDDAGVDADVGTSDAGPSFEAGAPKDAGLPTVAIPQGGCALGPLAPLGAGERPNSAAFAIVALGLLRLARRSSKSNP